MNKSRILNIDIDNITQKELLEKLHEGILVTPNVDHIIKLQKDRQFYHIYQQVEWVICDSRILYKASSFIKQNIKEVIPGSSFFPAYCEYHKNNNNIKIFLLGAAPGVAEDAKDKINNKIGRQIIVGAHSPSFGFEKNTQECNNIIDIINAADATVLSVGVGAPKQEKWIFEYRDKLPNIKLFMALGATIDFEAGNIKRAPILMQKIGMEWLYRLIKEPKRLWKRYLIDDMVFFYYIILQKIGLYRNPFESSKE